jgi:hypothetical protein
MNLTLGSLRFQNIRIPVLWGNRAIIQEPNLVLSVIDIGDILPALEILRNEPALGVNFIPKWSGFQILRVPAESYEFDVREKAFTSETLDLPDVQVDEFYIRVGSDVYPNTVWFEDAVGLYVTSDDVRIGAPMPSALLRLVDRRTRVA